MTNGPLPMLLNRCDFPAGIYVVSYFLREVVCPSTSTSPSPSSKVTCSPQLWLCIGARRPGGKEVSPEVKTVSGARSAPTRRVVIAPPPLQNLGADSTLLIQADSFAAVTQPPGSTSIIRPCPRTPAARPSNDSPARPESNEARGLPEVHSLSDLRKFWWSARREGGFLLRRAALGKTSSDPKSRLQFV